jgi:hypothetical protein
MDLDLDINNYNYGELQALLKLSPPFLMDDVDKNVTIFRERIFKSHDLDTESKNSVLQFLVNVKNRLLNTILAPIKEEKMAPVDIEQTAHNVIITKPLPNVSEIINPYPRKIIRRILNIDTRFRDNYYATESTNILINLPTTIEKVLSMELTSFEFPNSYFLIGKKYNNNYFAIKFYDRLAPTVYLEEIVIIPDGNYTRSQLQNVMNQQIAAAFVFPVWLTTVEVSIDDNSGRVVIAVEVIPSGTFISGQIGFSIIFNQSATGQIDSTPIQFKLGWLLGFREAIYNYEVPGPGPVWSNWTETAFVSEGIYDPERVRYVYLVIDDFNSSVNNYFIGAFGESILNPNILAKITLPTNTLSINNRSYEIGWKRDYFGPVRINKMKVQVLDEYGRIVDLNNMDYSLSLRFETLYDN